MFRLAVRVTQLLSWPNVLVITIPRQPNTSPKHGHHCSLVGYIPPTPQRQQAGGGFEQIAAGFAKLK